MMYAKLLLGVAFSATLGSIQAQIGSPLVPNTTIKMTFDEMGMLSIPPQGFALIEGSPYKLNIVVEKPEKAQKALWHMIAQKCLTVLNRLQDPDDTLALRFQTLYSAGDLANLEAELREMNKILTSADPVAAFNASAEDFTFFQGKVFIKDQLFGSIFTVYNSLTNASAAISATTNFELPAQPFVCPPDSFVLTVRVADLQKQFLRNYYLNARSQSAAVLDPIRPSGFYTKDVPAFASLQQRFDSLYKIVAAIPSNNLIICDQNIIDRYNELVSLFNSLGTSNNLSKIIQSDWLKVWFWYTEGNIAINPLLFTDKELLPLKDGFDQKNASLYDAYIKSTVELMSNSTSLNEAKTDYARMDSLLQQQGKGAEKFSFSASNDLLITANATRAGSGQAIEQTVHRLIFRAVPEDKTDKALLRTYDAGKQLKGSKNNFFSTLSNDVKVEAIVYNLKANEALSLKESPADIKDQSKIITQLNEAGDAFSGVLGQAATALPAFKNLVSQFTNARPEPTFSPVVIPQPHGIGFSAFSFRMPAPNTVVTNYSLRPAQSRGDLRVKLFADSHPVDQTPNILAVVDRYLRTRDLSSCPFFVNKVHQEIIRYVTASRATFNAQADLDSATSENLISISTGMASIIDSLYQLYSLKSKFDDLASKRNYLTIVADLFGLPQHFTLPPKIFKDEKNDSPLFRNEYAAFGQEQTAKRKDFELTLTDKKTKEEIKLKDSYKTAPTHLFAGSLGVAYIFNSFRRSEGVVTNGTITNTPDEDQVRLIAGLNIYILAPIVLADDRSVFTMKSWQEIRSRLSLFAGVSFPKPLYNLHPGISVDIWPGVKVTGGVHFYRYTSYKILNNQIADQTSKYVFNGGFAGLTIEPGTLVKLIGLFK